MKILQFINQLGNGGAEKLCVEMCNEQARRHDVVLCSATRIEPGMIPPRKLSRDVRLIQLNLGKKSLKGFPQICRILRREKPDIVHIHSSLLFYYFALFVIFFKRIQFVHTIHSTVTPGYRKLFGVMTRTRFLSGNLHHVCISSSNLKEYQTGYPKLRFHKIDNGIAPMETTPELPQVRAELDKIRSGRDYLFIAIGNYSIFKNFPMLVEVIRRLNRKGYKLALIILGEDTSPDRAQWNRVAQVKDRHTHQLGIKSNVADYLSCADALVISSTREGVPLVVLEALSIGIQVISTPAGGVMDKIRPGVNGFLARGFEPEDLEREILAFIQSNPPGKQKKPKEIQVTFPSRYSMEKCAAEYLQFYNSVLRS